MKITAICVLALLATSAYTATPAGWKGYGCGSTATTVSSTAPTAANTNACAFCWSATNVLLRACTGCYVPSAGAAMMCAAGNDDAATLVPADCQQCGGATAANAALAACASVSKCTYKNSDIVAGTAGKDVEFGAGGATTPAGVATGTCAIVAPAANSLNAYSACASVEAPAAFKTLAFTACQSCDDKNANCDWCTNTVVPNPWGCTGCTMASGATTVTCTACAAGTSPFKECETCDATAKTCTSCKGTKNTTGKWATCTACDAAAKTCAACTTFTAAAAGSNGKIFASVFATLMILFALLN